MKMLSTQALHERLLTEKQIGEKSAVVLYKNDIVKVLQKQVLMAYSKYVTFRRRHNGPGLLVIL